jgi:hypothetical protein
MPSQVALVQALMSTQQLTPVVAAAVPVAPKLRRLAVREVEVAAALREARELRVLQTQVVVAAAAADTTHLRVPAVRVEKE